MTTDRNKRVDRLVTLHARGVEVGQATLARLLRVLEQERQVHGDLDAMWSDAALATLRPRVSTAAEVQEAHRYIEGLRQRVDRAAEIVAKAEADAERARELLTEARQKLRKLEIWRDGLMATATAEANRRARVQEDELAARMRPARSA